jgi:hypothetical protein
MCAQSGDGAGVLSPGSGAGGGGARKHLSFGLGEVGQSAQRQPGDFFARMFGCFTPRVSEVA